MSPPWSRAVLTLCKKGVGVSVNIGFSSTKSESNEERHNTTVAGSLIQSGGDTTIIARGRESEDGTGDLAIIGSEVHAGGKVILDAANDIILKSAEETHDFASSNKNDSFGVGVGINIGAGKDGKDGKVGISASVNANASTSQGSAEGSSTRHIETIIQGDKGVDFTSGNDTTLKGAQIIGEQITGNVGGDLAIISEQDTYNESRNQDSKGGSISIGSGLGSISGSYNQQTQKGNADYASVDEQSGIYAGDGGFDITVGDNTGLTGAVIASTADPEDNRLTTGTLTTEDINNSMSYDASTKGIGGEFTHTKDSVAPGSNTGSISPSLPMEEKDDGNSTTKSAIAEGTVTITDEDAQLATTGDTADDTIASLNRDTDNAHNGPLERPPSIEELLAKQAELIEASAAAGKAVAKTVGDISKYMYENNDQDPRWGEGGIYKIILQGAGAALIAQLGNGEGLNAALGAMASQLAAKEIHKFASEFASHLADDPSTQQLIANMISNVLSTGIGVVSGGETGGNLASTFDRNNRQLHPMETMTIIKLATDENGVVDAEKLERLLAAANALVKGYAEYPEDSPSYFYYKMNADYAENYYQEEIELLKSYQNKDFSNYDPTTGINYYYYDAFTYSKGDTVVDLAKKTSNYPRVQGTFRMVGGAAEVATAGYALSTPGINVAAGTTAVTLGIKGTADFGTGLGMVLSGNYMDPMLVTLLTDIGGLSKNQAAIVDIVSSMGLSYGVSSFVAKDVSKYYDSLASKATKGTLDSNVVVLGKYEGNVPTSYQRVAKENNKLYFELNIDEWNYYTNFLGDEGAWRINQTFIDQNVLLGREFQFSHDISTATGSFAITPVTIDATQDL